MKYNTLQEQIHKFKKLTGLLNESVFPIIDEFIEIGIRKLLSKAVIENKEFSDDLIKSGRIIVDNETGKVVKILIDDQTPFFVWKTLFRSPEMRSAFEELLIKKGFKLNQINDPSFLPLVNTFSGLKRGIEAYTASAGNVIIETFWGKQFKTVREFFTEFLKGFGQAFSGPNFLKGIYDKVMPNVNKLKGEFEKNLESILTKYSLNDTNINKEMKELERILGQLRLREEQQHATLYKMWTEELKKHPKMKRLFDPKDPFYILKDATNNQTFREILKQYETSNGVNDAINSMTGKWEATKKLFSNPGKIGFWKKFGNIGERLFNVSLMWDPRKWKELSKNKKALGWGRIIGYELGGKIQASVTLIPAILSVYKVLGAYSESWLQSNGYDYDVPLTDKAILDEYDKEMTRGTAWGYLFVTQYVESLGIRAGELSTMPAWSLDAYYLLGRYKGGWKPGDFENQKKFVTEKSKNNQIEIDSAGQSNPEIDNTLKLIDAPKVDTIINAIDQELNLENVNPQDLIKK
jgi:hypothetical protein